MGQDKMRILRISPCYCMDDPMHYVEEQNLVLGFKNERRSLPNMVG